MEYRTIYARANMRNFDGPSLIAGVLFGGETNAHKFVIDDERGEAFAGTVTAKFLRYADEVTVPLTGSIESGKATVTLISNCYAKPGRFKLTVYVTANGSTTEIYCCMGTVDRTDGQQTIDPSGEINLDVTNLINRINTAVGSIPPEYSKLVNEVDSLSDLNAQNLLVRLNYPNGTQGGVTCTYNGNGSYTLTGTASVDEHFHLWTEDAPAPYFFNPGMTYRAWINSESIKLRFAWLDANDDFITAIITNGTEVLDVVIPDNAAHMRVSLVVPAGTTVNDTVFPYCLGTLTNYELTDRVKAVEAVAAGAVRFDTAQTMTDVQKAQGRENIGAASGEDVSELKSAVNNAKSVANVPSTLAVTFSSVSAAVDPATGANGTTGARSGYISFDKPICIDYNEDGFTYCVWVYTTNSTTAASYSPTGKSYVTGRTIINPVAGTNPCFRVGLHKTDGSVISSTDATAEFAKMEVYSLADDKLETTGAPADAKVAGDAARAAYDEGANLIPYYKNTAEKTDTTGITWSCQSGVFALSGSTSSIFFVNLAGSTDRFPLGVHAGDTVYLEAATLKNTNVYVAFRPYKNGSTYGAYQYNDDHAFTIPVDATGMQIRLEIPTNRTLAAAVTYKPVLRLVPGNAELNQRLAANEEKLEAYENVMLADNAVNIVPPFDHTQSTDNGITWSASAGEMTMSGTASSSFYTIIAGSSTSLPRGMVAGGTYLFWLNGPSALRLSVFTLPGGSNVFETSGVGYFTIPSTATGVQIRVRVPSGQTVPSGTVVRPFVGLNIPNAAIKTLAGFKPAKPMLTIIDDDGNSRFYTKLLPIIKSKNVPIASAIICGRPGVHEATMTWAQIVECYENGAEILSHSMTHLTGDVAETLTEPEIEMDYRQSKHALAARGMPTNILVYPGNSGNNDKCVTAAQHVFDFAIHSAGDVMTTQNYFRPYYIQRYGLGISEFVPESGQTVGANPKTYLDACAAGSGWMVWMIHTSSGDWTDAQVDGIEAAIDYARELGIDIVTCEYALKQFVRV